MVPVGVALREVPAMRRAFGRRFPLASRAAFQLVRRHPRQPEHWYLHYLGVVPSRQGRGLGSMLLRPMLERCDREGLPAYLEASSARSRALYERLGFELTGRPVDLPNGPQMWPMWREPRGGPAASR
jgi:ribosomal protein S18 acetylase RimI-like enzyme